MPPRRRGEGHSKAECHECQKTCHVRSSSDPDKLRDIVGLHVDPPAHAIVLSVRPAGVATETRPLRDDDPAPDSLVIPALCSITS
jgi:hypothetical protein